MEPNSRRHVTTKPVATPPTTNPAAAQGAADRKTNAGSTPNPWDACALLTYGSDRTLASAVQSLVIDTPPEGRARVEEQLLQVLALPECTDAGRAFLCQMLALAGSAASVPALTALLREAKSTEDARYALQAIPGAEADAVLRDALPSLSGAAKAGLIGSIAVRGDKGAKAALGAVKDNPGEPALVREAASRALERLATTDA